jgi:hypothetical protein
VGAKEIDPILPLLEKMETSRDPTFADTRSGFPSPFKSPIAILLAEFPEVKSTLGSNAIIPAVPEFLNTETLFAPKLAIAISWYPSPSMSSVMMLWPSRSFG